MHVPDDRADGRASARSGGERRPDTDRRKERGRDPDRQAHLDAVAPAVVDEEHLAVHVTFHHDRVESMGRLRPRVESLQRVAVGHGGCDVVVRGDEDKERVLVGHDSLLT